VAIATTAPPYGTYAALVGAFGAGVAGVAAVAGALGRRPEQLRPLDLLVLSAATFKAARTIAHDEVTSFIREPFVQEQAHEGDEHAVEDGGARQALGELLTCTRCVGMWTAGALGSLHVLAPRTGRMLTWSLAAAAANDFLQAGFSALTAKSNELEERVES
jgi:Protein of unknown function (DUF1360)